jgi:hypothetical protein
MQKITEIRLNWTFLEYKSEQISDVVTGGHYLTQNEE